MIQTIIVLALLSVPSLQHSHKKCKKRKVVQNETFSLEEIRHQARIHNFFHDDHAPRIKKDPNLQVIVHGDRVNRKDYPFVALLYVKSENRSIIRECTGVAVTDVLMLTTARCIPDDDMGTITVLMGFKVRDNAKRQSRVATMVPWDSMEIHPFFDDKSSNYDIAVFQYDTAPGARAPIDNNLYPLLNQVPNLNYTKAKGCTVLGYGAVDRFGKKSNILRQTDVLLTYSHDVVPSIRFKTTHRGGPCAGDFGGPLFCRMDGIITLVGLFSSIDTTSCGSANYAGTATPIGKHFLWILYRYSMLPHQGFIKLKT